MEKHLTVLAVESSCDETSASVVRDGKEVLSNVIASQIEIHKKYGGVVPEVASRQHMENVIGVMEEAILKSGLTLEEIDVFGVTNGPGLVGALLVGVSTVKSLAYGLGKPFIGVNHIEGHILANAIEHELDFPLICLVVSGGHTHLVLVKDYGEYEVLGRTLDDAAGEAYDKTARILGLGYPGGPKVEALAKEGDPFAIEFPKAYLSKDSLDFSFSGLKSAVINYVHQQEQKNLPYSKADVAAGFQEAVIQILEDKLFLAVKQMPVKTIALAGGVASNGTLRDRLKARAEKEGLRFLYPSPVYCTDNGAMIGVAAYHQYEKRLREKRFSEISDLSLNAYANMPLVAK